MELAWKKKDERNVLETKYKNHVAYLSFPALEETGLVKHGFSTRLGGVSEGVWSSMNLSFTREMCIRDRCQGFSLSGCTRCSTKKKTAAPTWCWSRFPLTGR